MDCCGLKDKAIIVTGAAVGIGRVTAVRFALGVSNGLLKWSKPPKCQRASGQGLRRQLTWLVKRLDSWRSPMFGQSDRLGRRLPFERPDRYHVWISLGI